jgi:hypothetical protein
VRLTEDDFCTDRSHAEVFSDEDGYMRCKAEGKLVQPDGRQIRLADPDAHARLMAALDRWAQE